MKTEYLRIIYMIVYTLGILALVFSPVNSVYYWFGIVCVSCFPPLIVLS